MDIHINITILTYEAVPKVMYIHTYRRTNGSTTILYMHTILIAVCMWSQSFIGQGYGDALSLLPLIVVTKIWLPFLSDISFAWILTQFSRALEWYYHDIYFERNDKVPHSDEMATGVIRCFVLAYFLNDNESVKGVQSMLY